MPPWSGPPPPPPPPPNADAAAHSKAAYAGLSRTDPDAVWVYQTWIWRGFDSPANLNYLKGWIGAIPPGKALMLDQTAEWTPIWQKFNDFVFLGVDFIWCTMSTMGGNVGMYGDIERLNTGPIDAAKAKNSSMVGVGIDPEGINTNPAYCESFNPHPSKAHALLSCLSVLFVGLLFKNSPRTPWSGSPLHRHVHV